MAPSTEVYHVTAPPGLPVRPGFAVTLPPRCAILSTQVTARSPGDDHDNPHGTTGPWPAIRKP